MSLHKKKGGHLQRRTVMTAETNARPRARMPNSVRETRGTKYTKIARVCGEKEKRRGITTKRNTHTYSHTCGRENELHKKEGQKLGARQQDRWALMTGGPTEANAPRFMRKNSVAGMCEGGKVVVPTWMLKRPDRRGKKSSRKKQQKKHTNVDGRPEDLKTTPRV